MPPKNKKAIRLSPIIEEAGNSIKLSRGEWRDIKPVHIPEKCTDCLICWSMCPDTAIEVRNQKFHKINYRHCKGCLICVNECPFGALRAEPEEK